MIRLAVEADTPKLVELGARFHAASPYADLPYLPEKVAETLRGLLENGAVFVCDQDGIKGMAAVMCGPMWFSNEVAAQELFWWSDGCGEEAHRLREAIEVWARDNGCALFLMGCLEDETTPVLARLYRRQGFRPVERHFLKEL